MPEGQQEEAPVIESLAIRFGDVFLDKSRVVPEGARICQDFYVRVCETCEQFIEIDATLLQYIVVDPVHGSRGETRMLMLLS